MVQLQDGNHTLVDQVTWEDINSQENLLKIRYKDGKFFNTTTLTEIKNKLNAGTKETSSN